MDNMSLSDIAAVTRNVDGDGWGAGGGWIMIILFALIFGGNGLWGNNNRGNAVTEADLCNANSFSELKNSVGRLSDQVGDMNVGFTKGLCDFGYTTLTQFNALEKQLSDCCCQNQLATQSVKFDMANYAAGTNAAVAAMGQKILDKMAADREASLQARVNQLELQQAMCGVIKYPMSSAYAAGSPFFGCSPSCCTNIYTLRPCWPRIGAGR